MTLRQINDVPSGEIELIRLMYVLSKTLTLAEVAQANSVRVRGLRRLSSSEGWQAMRMEANVEVAQLSHFDTGKNSAKIGARMSNAVDLLSTAAVIACEMAVDTGDAEDFNEGLRQVTHANDAWVKIKDTIGPSASGLSQAGAPSQANAASGHGVSDEHVPANVISSVDGVLSAVVREITDKWSDEQQRKIDEQQIQNMEKAGVDPQTMTQTPPPAAAAPGANAPASVAPPGPMVPPGGPMQPYKQIPTIGTTEYI